MRWLLIATLVISLASFVSCSGTGRVDGPVLTSPRQPLIGGGGMDAGVGGTVVFDESTGCLYLGAGNLRSPVVWPQGASWQPDPPAVKLQGQVIEPGMAVSGGGGYIGHERVENLAGAAVADAALACVTGPYDDIAFFNRGSEVRVATDY